MSGHSKFANIKHKKEKNDAAKGKIFTIISCIRQETEIFYVFSSRLISSARFTFCIISPSK